MHFKLSEAACIIDVMNGIRYTEGVSKHDHLYHNVVDAIVTDNLNEKWDFEEDELDTFVVKLQNLSEEESAEVLEKIDFFWSRSPIRDLEFELAQSGLIPKINWRERCLAAYETGCVAETPEVQRATRKELIRCLELVRAAANAPMWTPPFTNEGV